MSPVEFKERPCRTVEFKGQGPSKSLHVRTEIDLVLMAPINLIGPFFSGAIKFFPGQLPHFLV